MKIALDLDGTLVEHRDFFVWIFAPRLHNVGILTSRNDVEEVFKKLNLSIKWPAFIIQATGEDRPNAEMSSYAWKAAKIKEHEIDVVFDDHGDHIEPLLAKAGTKCIVFKSYWKRKEQKA